jgi:DNA helicase HerA-like ATPase
MIDIELGIDTVRRTPVSIAHSARARHTYISGQTGTGKSALLLNIAGQLARSEGFAFIDPHGQNAEALLSLIPPSRADDLAYIDLAERDQPIGLNLLSDVPKDTRSTVADNILTSFISIFGREAVGDRSQEVLRNSLLALMETDGSSLLSVVRLLRSEGFRRSVISRISDPLVVSYWTDEFENYDDRYREQVVSPILNKLDAVLSHVAIRHILSQPTSSIDLRATMDQGRILIVNLRKGSIGAQASRFFGALLVSGIVRAAFSRDTTTEADRRPFDLILDEFQSFATPEIAEGLSELRKYGLYLTLAHQYLDQIPETVRSAVFGNVGTFIAFRSGADDARELARHYEKEPGQFLGLPNFQAWVRPLVNGAPGTPVRVETMPPPDSVHPRPHRLIRNSRVRFGRSRGKVEAQVRSALTR